VSPRCSKSSPTPKPSGSGCRFSTGIARAGAWSRSPLARPFGTTAVSPLWPSVGCWYGTPKASSSREPCSAPTSARRRAKSWNGSCCAGKWKSPSRKFVLSHLPGSSCSPWGGDATAVVRPGDCSHDSRAIRFVLTGHPARPPLGSSRNLASKTIRLVRQDPTHLLRCHCLGAPAREYGAAYSRPGRMRAAWAYFVSFQQAANDFARFAQTKLPMPVLSLGGEKATARL
jgi:hypothetical protein